MNASGTDINGNKYDWRSIADELKEALQTVRDELRGQPVTLSEECKAKASYALHRHGTMSSGFGDLGAYSKEKWT